ncbi:MAG: serine/threonine protein kinase [Kiritimatiellae bacterium]|nr:serine/threonine protein kinase [Kiritimatiellia bacterium]
MVEDGMAARCGEEREADGVAAAFEAEAGALLERCRAELAAEATRTKRVFPEGAEAGEWTVMGFLGRGGSSEVYCARRRRDGLTAALKVLYRQEEGPRKRFWREAQFLAGCEGAAFPAFYGAGETLGRAWMALERLEEYPLPEGDAAVARYVLEVGEAVSALHAKGWVHRDIKPANVLRRAADGRAVLADFGLLAPLGGAAWSGERLSVVDGRAVGVGTPGYAAPEQFDGGELSARTDVFSLGVLVNRCFGGKPPAAWREIVLLAAHSQPEFRYESVEAMMRAVRGRGGAAQ